MMTPLNLPKLNNSPYNSSKSHNNLRSPPPSSSSPLNPSYPDLPSDPKIWTSSHVATYLAYCLRIYPPAIISDLSRYVEDDASFTGKKFLRLKEEQLKQMNFNERWVKLIMIAVKTLRREHLKDKILLNGGDIIISPESDDIKIIEESSEEQCSSYPSSSTAATDHSSFSSDDSKDFLIPTTCSKLTSDDKEFICQEFNKLREVLKSDTENKNYYNNNADFNELKRIIKKVISIIEVNREENDNNNVKDEVDKESFQMSRSFFSLFFFDWLNNDEWTKKTIFESGFVQGIMIGGVAVWAFMRYK